MTQYHQLAANALILVVDAWDEKKHPRAKNGKFTSSGGEGQRSKPPKPPKPPKSSTKAAKKRADADALDMARSRALDRTSFPQATAIAAAFGSARSMDQLSAVRFDLENVKLSKDGWHALARMMDSSYPASYSGSQIKEKILGRVRSLLTFEMKRLSRDGRSAA